VGLLVSYYEYVESWWSFLFVVQFVRVLEAMLAGKQGCFSVGVFLDDVSEACVLNSLL